VILGDLVGMVVVFGLSSSLFGGIFGSILRASGHHLAIGAPDTRPTHQQPRKPPAKAEKHKKKTKREKREKKEKKMSRISPLKSRSPNLAARLWLFRKRQT
jgi:hypothetical protein